MTVVQPDRDLRYERKARGTELSYFELEHRVRIHPALFREIFFERKVNNVYLDTVDLASFEENLSGIQDRSKLRVRWYGELSGEIERPVLEIKFKSNMVGGKQRFPLTPLTLSSRFEGRTLVDWLRAHALPGAVRSHLASQEPRLLNRYSRRYFQSQDGRFRITLDRHLEYYRLHAGRNLLLQRRSDPDDVVIEMKYRVEDDRLADDASSHFPFLWTKSSKYVTGIEGLWWPGSR